MRYLGVSSDFVCFRRISKNTAGTTNIDNKGALIIPPTMGAAIRCMTSLPVPVPHIIGISPARMVSTVMALGRTRSTAPFGSHPANLPLLHRRALPGWPSFGSGKAT